MTAENQVDHTIYTLDETVKFCLSQLDGDLNFYDAIAEPNDGSGNFLNHINHDNEVSFNYLLPTTNAFQVGRLEESRRVLVLGNPPFGTHSQLSRRLLKHVSSLGNVQTIAMILPDTYNKHTLQRQVDPIFRLKSVTKLPANSFMRHGEYYDAPCSFFVFDKSAGPCLRFRAEEHKDTPHFSFGSEQDHDFFVIGAAPHNIKPKSGRHNRGHYIKVKPCVDIEQVKQNFKRFDWHGFSAVTGGVFWLNQAELAQQYKAHLEQE